MESLSGRYPMFSFKFCKLCMDEISNLVVVQAQYLANDIKCMDIQVVNYIHRKEVVLAYI